MPSGRGRGSRRRTVLRRRLGLRSPGSGAPTPDRSSMGTWSPVSPALCRSLSLARAFARSRARARSFSVSLSRCHASAKFVIRFQVCCLFIHLDVHFGFRFLSIHRQQSISMRIPMVPRTFEASPLRSVAILLLGILDLIPKRASPDRMMQVYTL